MEQYKSTSVNELTYGNDYPYIDIQWKRGLIFIPNAVFRLIGKPTGIRFLWNNTKCTLVIEPADISTPDAFPIIATRYAQHNSLFIGSITLINKIWSVTEWDKKLRYRIMAKYDRMSNVAIFEMKNAIASEIPKHISCGRPKKLK